MKKFFQWYEDNKFINPLLVLLLIATCIFLFTIYVKQKSVVNAQETTIQNMAIDSSNFTVVHQKDSSTITEQAQLILTQADIVKKLRIDSETLALKNINLAVKFNSNVTVTNKKFEVDSIYYPPYNIKDSTTDLSNYPAILDTTGSDSFWGFSSNGIDVENKFHYKDRYLYLSVSVFPDSLKLDSLSLPNTQLITIGNKKMGFLKTPKPVVQIYNSNPYFKITSMKNGSVLYKEPIYKKPIPWLILGIVAGAYVTSKL